MTGLGAPRAVALVVLLAWSAYVLGRAREKSDAARRPCVGVPVEVD